MMGSRSATAVTAGSGSCSSYSCTGLSRLRSANIRATSSITGVSRYTDDPLGYSSGYLDVAHQLQDTPNAKRVVGVAHCYPPSISFTFTLGLDCVAGMSVISWSLQTPDQSITSLTAVNALILLGAIPRALAAAS